MNQILREPSSFTLGCAQLGNLYKARSDEEAAAILQSAWDSGVRDFDTAPHYGLGLSEQRLGAFLRDKPRDAYTVSTKVGRLLVPNASGSDRLDDEGFVVPATMRRVWDFTAAGVRASLEESLTRMGLDYVDTALIHDPNEFPEQALHQAVPALRRLHEEGLVRSVGVGNRDTALLTRFVHSSGVDTVMLAGRYTLLDQSALDELFPACLVHDVTVSNAAVFNSGILAHDHPDSGARFDYAAAPAAVLKQAQQLAAICERHGTPLPAAALAFSAAHPVVGSVVVGADDAEQARRNAELLRSPPPASFWDDVRSAHLIRPDAPLPWQSAT